MKKKLLTFTVLLMTALILVTSLISCAKVEKTVIEPVEATIVDVYHRGTYATTIMAGKTPVVVTHPATWKVTLRYEDIETTINNKDLYNACKDNIGCTITVNLVTDTYTDGEIKRSIKLIETED